MLEFIYTSARAGLKPGSSGFTFVAWTKGIPPYYLAPLENISGYKPIWLPGTPECAKNPVSFSYRKIRYGALVFSALSRTGYAGLDYSGRTNKLAHHIIPDEGEFAQSPYGPCGFFLSSGNFRSVWEQESMQLDPRRLKMPPSPASKVAQSWKVQKGDAGWAGVAAAKLAALITSGKTEDESVYLEYSPDFPTGTVLKMVAEVLLLLPPELQQKATFDTYFMQPLLGVETLLRCGLPDNQIIQTMHRLKPENVISLMSQEELPASMAENPYVYAARGETPVLTPSPAERRKTICLGKIQPQQNSSAQEQPQISFTAEPQPRQSEAAAPRIIRPVQSSEKAEQESLLNNKLKRIGIFVILLLVITGIIGVFFLKTSHQASKGLEETEEQFSAAPAERPSKVVPAAPKIDRTPQAVVVSVPATPKTQTAPKQQPKTQPKQQPKRHVEKWKKEDGFELFCKLNKAIDNPNYEPLIVLDSPIRSFCIYTGQGKLVSLKDQPVMFFPSKAKPMFAFSAEKEKFFLKDVWDNKLDPALITALKTIEYLEIELPQKTVHIDFPGGVGRFLDKLQPSFSINDNFLLKLTDSPLLQKYNCMDYYLKKPDFSSGTFTALHSCIVQRDEKKNKWDEQKTKEEENLLNAILAKENYSKSKAQFNKCPKEKRDQMIQEMAQALRASRPAFRTSADYKNEVNDFSRMTGKYTLVKPDEEEKKLKALQKETERARKAYHAALDELHEEYRRLKLEKFFSLEQFDALTWEAKKNILLKAAEIRGSYKAK